MSYTSENQVITIDGPCGSGKSSVAFELARLLGGWQCISTGLMYRAVAIEVAALDENQRASAARHYANAAKFEFQTIDDECHLLVNGVDKTQDVKDPAVLPITADIAQDERLREILIAHQRALTWRHDSIVEGRDAGSRVIPAAKCKFYLDAAPEVRYKRLYTIHCKSERPMSYDEFVAKMEHVDARDMARLSSVRASSQTIYHLNYEDLSAYQDAVILFYYLTRTAEICDNVSTDLLSAIARRCSRSVVTNLGILD